MRVNYKLIENLNDLHDVIEYCHQTGEVCLDFETTDLGWYKLSEYPTILGLSFQMGSEYILPLGHYESPFAGSYEKILREFGKNVISNPHITKIGYNFKYEYKWFLKYGITPKGRLFDTMLAKYLLNEEKPHDLKSLVDRYFPDFAGYDISKGKNFNWANVPLDELSYYCAVDVAATYRLHVFFEKRLIDLGLYLLYRNLLLMSMRVLAKSEFLGFNVDEALLDELIHKYKKLIEDNKKEIKNLPIITSVENNLIRKRKRAYIRSLKSEIDSGELTPRQVSLREEKIRNITLGKASTNKEIKIFEPLNLNSVPQMIEVLYNNKAGFKFDIIEKTETGNPATGEDVLLKLQKQDKSGFIKALLKSRELEKLNSTYIVGLKDKLYLGKIHGSYLIHGTVTGRYSSRDPNMQNIPRPTTNPDIKRLFIPPPGYLLVECDYSQAELRIAAELANEESMIDMFNTGRDIHLATTAKTQHRDYDELLKIYENENHPDHIEVKKARKKSKTVNFGILYGQTAKKLSESLSEQSGSTVSLKEAQTYLDAWFEAFPKIAKWIRKQHRIVKRDKYVVNIFGFKRRLPNIDSPNFGERLEAERQSVNAQVQGGASYFTAFAGVMIERLRLNDKIPLDFPQVYTVHDSLGFYVAKNKIHEFNGIVMPLMKDPDTMDYFGFKLNRVSMKSDMEVGTNWANIKPYDHKEDYTKW